MYHHQHQYPNQHPVAPNGDMASPLPPHHHGSSISGPFFAAPMPVYAAAASAAGGAGPPTPLSTPLVVGNGRDVVTTDMSHGSHDMHAPMHAPMHAAIHDMHATMYPPPQQQQQQVYAVVAQPQYDAYAHQHQHQHQHQHHHHHQHHQQMQQQGEYGDGVVYAHHVPQLHYDPPQQQPETPVVVSTDLQHGTMAHVIPPPPPPAHHGAVGPMYAYGYPIDQEQQQQQQQQQEQQQEQQQRLQYHYHQAQQQQAQQQHVFPPAQPAVMGHPGPMMEYDNGVQPHGPGTPLIGGEHLHLQHMQQLQHVAAYSVTPTTAPRMLDDAQGPQAPTPEMVLPVPPAAQDRVSPQASADDVATVTNSGLPSLAPSGAGTPVVGAADAAPLTQMQQLPLTEQLAHLHFFLATAPTNWQPHERIRRFLLPNGEHVSCVLNNNLFHITGTDIVRALLFRFQAIGRPVRSLKKFEEGIFSDLRNLKPGIDASLETNRSDFLEWLYKHNCVRTQKKQKVFYWFSVPWDQLFYDALERDLKREALNLEPTSVPVAMPPSEMPTVAGNYLLRQHIENQTAQHQQLEVQRQQQLEIQYRRTQSTGSAPGGGPDGLVPDTASAAADGIAPPPPILPPSGSPTQHLQSVAPGSEITMPVTAPPPAPRSPLMHPMHMGYSMASTSAGGSSVYASSPMSAFGQNGNVPLLAQGLAMTSAPTPAAYAPAQTSVAPAATPAPQPQHMSIPSGTPLVAARAIHPPSTRMMISGLIDPMSASSTPAMTPIEVPGAVTSPFMIHTSSHHLMPPAAAGVSSPLTPLGIGAFSAPMMAPFLTAESLAASGGPITPVPTLVDIGPPLPPTSLAMSISIASHSAPQYSPARPLPPLSMEQIEASRIYGGSVTRSATASAVPNGGYDPTAMLGMRFVWDDNLIDYGGGSSSPAVTSSAMAMGTTHHFDASSVFAGDLASPPASSAAGAGPPGQPKRDPLHTVHISGVIKKRRNSTLQLKTLDRRLSLSQHVLDLISVPESSASGVTVAGDLATPGESSVPVAPPRQSVDSALPPPPLPPSSSAADAPVVFIKLERTE